MTGLRSLPLDGIEIWKPVVGYEGLYEVSNFGSVRSLPRVVHQKNRHGTHTDRHWPGQVLTQAVDRTGRLVVTLCDRKSWRISVHRLVASAFIGPCPAGKQVAHGDGNPKNNRLSNLRYATPAENQADRILHGTDLRGEDNASSKITEMDVLEIRAMTGEMPLREIGRLFGIGKSQVFRIVNGTSWAHVAGGENGF